MIYTDYRFLNMLRKLFGMIFALMIVSAKEKKLRLSSLFLIFTGVIYRMWAAGTICKNKELSTKGPYSLSRNPLYFGSFLLGAGFTLLLFPVSVVIVYTGAFLLCYFPKMKQEEADLKRFFGERFCSYQKSTPLFFPESLKVRKEKFSLKKMIDNREYNTLIAVLLLLLLIFCRNSSK